MNVGDVALQRKKTRHLRQQACDRNSAVDETYGASASGGSRPPRERARHGDLGEVDARMAFAPNYY
jgi:hypothetical protein